MVTGVGGAGGGQDEDDEDEEVDVQLYERSDNRISTTSSSSLSLTVAEGTEEMTKGGTEETGVVVGRRARLSASNWAKRTEEEDAGVTTSSSSEGISESDM
jgi:hypothetical protein